MSAVRQLFVAVWAALWVRWRLLAVEARRTFVGRRAAVAGSGYYLGAAEIPVEGVDYELVDLPPELAARLDATRSELVERARATTARQVRRRRARRRRTTSLAMAALLTLAVLGAGASALVTGSTGIPAVDRVLGIYEKNLGPQGPAGRLGVNDGGQRVDPSVSSTSIEFSAGGQPMVSAWYLAQNASVCSLLTEVDRTHSGDLACVPQVRLDLRLRSSGGEVFNVTEVFSAVVVRGYVRADVTGLEGYGPTGSLDMHLGDTWSPGTNGVKAMRPFVAVEQGVQGRLVTRRDYRIWAVTDDGDRLRIEP